MAAIENLELKVTVNIASAIAALEELQEELQDVAKSIEAVDNVGTEGVDVRTNVDNLDTELARTAAEIEAFEATHSLDIDTRVDSPMAQLAGFRVAETAPALPTPEGGMVSARMAENVFPEWMTHAAQSDMDFGGFNVMTPGGRLTDMDFGGGDNRTLGTMARRARRASKRLGNLTDRLKNVDIRMSDIHNLLATLVPLIVVFIGTIPAVITALVGLAAAAGAAALSLGALAAFGALGLGMEDGQFDMSNLQDAWENIKEDFLEAFGPLAEALQPLFEDALDGLTRFFQQVANQGDALMEMTDEARAFGGFLMDFVPIALRAAAALVEALAPALGDIGAAIEENFNFFMRELVRLTMEALPAVSALIQTIIGAIPTLVEISIQFTRVANAILEAVGFLWSLITVGGLLTDQFAFIAAAGLTLVSVLALLHKMSFLLNFQLLRMAGGALLSAIKGLFAYTGAVSSAQVGTMALARSILTLRGAVTALLATTGIGLLLVVVGQLATSFMSASEGINKATNSLKEFNRVAGRSDTNFNPYAEAPSGAGAASVSARGSEKTVINIETSGNTEDDKSNARYAGWRQGRTTGGGA